MIYYFTGTGNSRAAASALAKSLYDNLLFIPHVNPFQETPDGESIGFVFPVYSWGVPPLVIDFIDRLGERFWSDVNNNGIPVWVVMTCGDEVALAPEMMLKALQRHKVEPESIWSVIMPNDYVLLPGFDVDSKELEHQKLDAAPLRIDEIVQGIKDRRKVIDVTRGSMPWIKSKLIYPLFKRWGVSPRQWHCTDDCINCGLCAKRCPLNNIEIDGSGRPKWGMDCCSCLACYHSCPKHAVEYGKATTKKGQYYHP